MSESSDHRQKWLGIGTLIVCVGILWALLMPAVRSGGYDANRRAQCMNNLKNLSCATLNFESVKKQFPGYQDIFGGREKGKIGTWVVSLMPFMPQATIEQQVLRDIWDDPNNYNAWLASIKDNDKKATETFYPPVNFLICPSDISQPAELGMSYAANAGFYLLPDDPALGLERYAQVEDASERSAISQRAANGLFANRLGPEVINPQTGTLTKVFGYCANKTRSSDVKDGTSHTILFAEHMNNLNWRDFSISDDSSRYQLGLVWLYAGKSASKGRPMPLAVTDEMRINHHKLIPASGPLRARPSGNHPGIITATFADGSTKSIDERIDYHVYQSLMAPHDAESDIPKLD